MPVLTVETDYSSSYYKDDVVYATAQGAASAEVMSSVPEMGQDIITGTYQVNRGGLFFDTSTIPSDAAIISAYLSLYCYSDNSTTDFNVTVVSGSALNNIRLVADYGGLLAATASGGTISSSAITLSAYNTLTLNATGLGFITKAGTTKLALRSSRDIAVTTPTNAERVEVLGIDATNPAKLTISYEAKGNLFVKAENLHYVSYTGIERYIQGIAV